MMPTRNTLAAATAIAILAAAPASATTCAGGIGTLTITARSDSLTLGLTSGTTFNVGEHVQVSAVAAGFNASNYSWTIDGPLIKDYNEDLGTEMGSVPAAPLPWSTTPITAADLQQQTVSFYWKPSPSQIDPLNGGPVTRNVTLQVNKSTGGTCTANASFNVERNLTDPNRQPEDFYTSNHRPNTTNNPLWGHVIDEHIYWHASVHNQTTFPTWTRFLAWHGIFLRRFDIWRQEFGYAKVAPWYPGRALPSGPAFDHAPRLVYNPDSLRLPTYYTITGQTSSVPANADPWISTAFKLADYASLSQFSMTSFEPHFHGWVHCAIGPVDPWGLPFPNNNYGPNFGSMCYTSSPKDPIFWRWHGFIDALYRNFCALHSAATCTDPSPGDPPADPWMADNASDTGVPPSPPNHWISTDIWNRRSLVTADACVGPVDAYGNHVTTGGVVRNCGSDADHENPEANTTNYLYGTLRNTLPGSPRIVYAEVGVYWALASTGLHYPADFTFIPESRQFIALHLEPGQTTSIGPIPWTVPALPPMNDHYCLYLRVLSVQESPPVESGSGIDHDVAFSNSLAWRNVKVVPFGDPGPPSFFIVRNIDEGTQRLGLRFTLPPALLAVGGTVRLDLDETLMAAARGAKLEGMVRARDGSFLITGAQAQIAGIALAPKQQGNVKLTVVGAKRPVDGDITIAQIGPRGIEGGVTLKLGARHKIVKGN
jgi:tyrosinase-like protein